MTSDPKAIQHIYNNSSVFVRQTNNRQILEMVMGSGLVTVGGEAHKRQRRVMQPAFGVSQLKALHPIFTRHVEKVRFILFITGAEIDWCSFPLW
jgi:cytochrome P450